VPKNHTFKIGDHEYLTSEHPGTEGQRVSWALLGSAAEPLGRLLGQVFSEEGALDRLQAEGATLTSMVDGLDLAKAGADLGSILALVDGPALTRQILRHTLRDDQPLDRDAVFDEAYAGNYAEMFRAVFKVAMINGFFPVPISSTRER